jgi:stage V sporulation protein R
LGQPSEDCGIWEYAKHKMAVLGGQYSVNPYKLGYEILLDIEDRWNKGKFGQEWDECKDMKEREAWDKKVGKGMEKVFEVRRYYNDFTLIQEFFTPELCQKLSFYEYRRFPNGEWKITGRDFKAIKDKLLKKYMNGGLPDIRLTDPNHLGKGWFFMQHSWDGRPLYDKYARETIISVHKLWQNTVILATQNTDGEQYVYICDGMDPDKDVHVLPRDQYETEYLK